TFKDLSSTINLYPNPAQNYIIIDLQNNKAAQVRIMNMQGQEITSILQPQGSDKITLPVNYLPQGVYIIEIQTAEGRAIKKFSKVR
ncbi:MAG: T9SS type A sorting domain-containing protein, partial [Bacteroidia bacterium]